jgi:Fe2+ transport system protein FeoA
MVLADAKQDEEVIITRLSHNAQLKNKLRAMGLYRGVKVSIHLCHNDGPMIIVVGTNFIALRQNEANQIHVKKNDTQKISAS